MKHYILTSGEYSNYGFSGIVAHPEWQDIKALLDEYMMTACPVDDRDENHFNFDESAFILWLTSHKGFTEIDVQRFHTHNYSICKNEDGSIDYN